MFGAYEGILTLAMGFASAYIALPEFRYHDAVKRRAKKKSRKSPMIMETRAEEPDFVFIKSLAKGCCETFREKKKKKKNGNPTIDSFEVTSQHLNSEFIRDFCTHFGIQKDRDTVVKWGVAAFILFLGSILVKLYFPSWNWASLVEHWTPEPQKLESGELTKPIRGVFLVFLVKTIILVICLYLLFVPIRQILKGRKCRDDLLAWVDSKFSSVRAPGPEKADVIDDSNQDAAKTIEFLKDQNIDVPEALKELVKNNPKKPQID